MADLNELSQFEKDLKHLIETRNAYQPNYNPPENYKPTPKATDQTYMMVWEHGQPYSSHREHKFPSHPTYSSEEIERLGRMGMFMGAVEHGQPYKVVRTKMALSEHGQPYKSSRMPSTRMAILEHGQPFTVSTNMAIKEHGQPYKTEEKKSFTCTTDMVREVHGQPYKANYMLL